MDLENQCLDCDVKLVHQSLEPAMRIIAHVERQEEGVEGSVRRFGWSTRAGLRISGETAW